LTKEEGRSGNGAWQIDSIKYYDGVNLPSSESRYQHSRMTGAVSFGNRATSLKQRYNLEGHLVSEILDIDPSAGQVSFDYEFDRSGALKRILFKNSSHPAGKAIEYARNELGRTTNIRYDGATLVYGLLWGPHGRPDEIAYTTSLRQSYSYNLRSQMTAINGTGPLGGYQYEYHPSGDVQRETLSARALNLQYTYDRLHRLLRADGTVMADDLRASYTYDESGNVLTAFNDYSGNRSGSPRVARSEIYQFEPDSNRFRTGPFSGLSYDEHGNLAAINQKRFSYDPLGRLKTIAVGTTQSMDLTYDGLGRKVARPTLDVGLETYFFSTAVGLVATHTNRGWRTQISADGLRLAFIDEDGVKSYAFSDRLSSTRAVTNVSGRSVMQADYWPYEGTVGNPGVYEPFLFTGKERQTFADGKDLYDFGGRYYDPNIRRFVEVDPVNLGRLSDARTMNRYGYAMGNPLRYIDPTGYEAHESREKEEEEKKKKEEEEKRKKQAAEEAARKRKEELEKRLAELRKRLEEELNKIISDREEAKKTAAAIQELAKAKYAQELDAARNETDKAWRLVFKNIERLFEGYMILSQLDPGDNQAIKLMNFLGSYAINKIAEAGVDNLDARISARDSAMSYRANTFNLGLDVDSLAASKNMQVIRNPDGSPLGVTIYPR
jgi:RHS repeat-associated protein